MKVISAQRKRHDQCSRPAWLDSSLTIVFHNSGCALNRVRSQLEGRYLYLLISFFANAAFNQTRAAFI